MVQKITARPGQEAYLTGPNETLSIPMIGSGVIMDGQVVARTTDGKSVQENGKSAAWKQRSDPRRTRWSACPEEFLQILL